MHKGRHQLTQLPSSAHLPVCTDAAEKPGTTTPCPRFALPPAPHTLSHSLITFAANDLPAYTHDPISLPPPASPYVSNTRHPLPHLPAYAAQAPRDPTSFASPYLSTHPTLATPSHTRLLVQQWHHHKAGDPVSLTLSAAPHTLPRHPSLPYSPACATTAPLHNS